MSYIEIYLLIAAILFSSIIFGVWWRSRDRDRLRVYLNGRGQRQKKGEGYKVADAEMSDTWRVGLNEGSIRFEAPGVLGKPVPPPSEVRYNTPSGDPPHLTPVKEEGEEKDVDRKLSKFVSEVVERNRKRERENPFYDAPISEGIKQYIDKRIEEKLREEKDA